MADFMCLVNGIFKKEIGVGIEMKKNITIQQSAEKKLKKQS